MKKSTQNNATPLLILLFAILVFAYKMLFMNSGDLLSSGPEDLAAARVSAELAQIQSIKFDTSVLDDPKFKAMKSIILPLIELPLGKSNLFSATK